MAPLPVFHRPLSMDSRDTSLTNSSSNSRPKGDTSAESGSGGGCVGGSTVSTVAASAAAGAAANNSASMPDTSVGADSQSTTTNPDLASSNDYLVPSSKASTPPRR